MQSYKHRATVQQGKSNLQPQRKRQPPATYLLDSSLQPAAALLVPGQSQTFVPWLDAVGPNPVQAAGHEQ